MMIRLEKSLRAWGTSAFNEVLKSEIEQLDTHSLPLQQGLSRSSHVADSGFRVMILRASEHGDSLYIKAGIFYSGIIAGCSCADDPTPVPEQSEYCEIVLEISKPTAETRITLNR